MKPLWRFPFNMPVAESGGVLDANDIVTIMEEQAASIGFDAPEYAEAQFELMRAYAMSRQFDKSRIVLQGLLDMDLPADAKARALVVMGGWAESAKDFAAAVEFYRKAAEFDPASYWARNNLAYSLSKLGRHEEAEPEARTAIAVAPDAFNAHKNLGIALEGLGRFADAARSYLMALRAAPFEPRAYNHLREMVGRQPETLQEVEGLAEEIEFYQRTGLMKRLIERLENPEL